MARGAATKLLIVGLAAACVVALYSVQTRMTGSGPTQLEEQELAQVGWKTFLGGAEKSGETMRTKVQRLKRMVQNFRQEQRSFMRKMEHPAVVNVKVTQGPRGLRGHRGKRGPTGAQGYTGIPGHDGHRGPKGRKGPQGIDGPTGFMGPRGSRGPTGRPGPKGNPGEAGPRGPTGLPGHKGPRGPRGFRGANGMKGQDGSPGPAGPSTHGARGPPGPPGPRGRRGPRGRTAPAGPRGPRGARGPRGRRGKNAVNGSRGPRGRKGPLIFRTPASGGGRVIGGHRRRRTRRRVRRPRLRPGIMMKYWHYNHAIRHVTTRGRPHRVLHQHRRIINMNGHGFKTPHRHRFSVRLYAKIWVKRTGRYTFYLGSDDGSHLWVDGRRLVSNGGLHGLRYRHGARTLRRGVHRIRIDFFENGGAATLRLKWKGPGTRYSYVPVYRSGRRRSRRRRRRLHLYRGLTMKYWHYNHAIHRLHGLMRGRPQKVLRQRRSYVNLNGHGFRTPHRHRFAVRLYAKIWVRRAGVYHFYLGSDDGSHLWVDGRHTISNGGLHGLRYRRGARRLKRGLHRIRIDFFENGGAATLRLKWRGPGVRYSYVPVYRKAVHH